MGDEVAPHEAGGELASHTDTTDEPERVTQKL